MLGTAAPGVANPLGIVDLNTGVFTLIGNMGSGGYDGLAVANGILYTEQNGLLYSVNTANANLTLIGGLTGENLATFGSTTTGLYGVAPTGSSSVATVFSINPETGAITTIGPLGASAVPNGQGFYARLSVGSSALYMEFNSNLYLINTTTGAATQVGTTSSNNYLTSVPLFENGTVYVGYGPGIGTINITTGQITPGSAISGGPGSLVALAPDPLPAGTPPAMLTANAYMLGTAAQGVENPFGIVDLNSGAFTLIGNMGSGGYDGLAVANGTLYTEQNGLLYSVNTANANLTLIGGVTGTPNLSTFGSTTTGLYGMAPTGSFSVETLFSINPQTGAITAIGPIGAIPNGQGYYARLSVGSSTLYMEFNGSLYTINTTTGAATELGTTDSHDYLSSVLLLEYGTYYAATDIGIATVNIATGQIDPHSSIFGAAGTPVALAPDPLTTAAPTITVVANAEGGVATIAPNSWVEIKGSNLAPSGDTRVWQTTDFLNNQLPTSLDGVSVTVNGVPAYVYYISPTQVNILTPPKAISGLVAVQLTNNGVTSANFMVQAQAESPSFFVFGGGPYIAATHVNGSYLGPTGLYPGLTTPAQPGETVVMYANGFGSTSTPVVSGSETQSGTLSPMPVITIGGATATVTFAGLVAPGEFQFNVVVPPSLANGDQPTMAMYNGLTTQAGALITVQQ
ncbi:MAG TPA: IPT/TIG domain-containing protein [Bryobacteraceae bacterium]|nr:IPT/TIG domain-containing protein [Bryobacteraceae bacterium]